MTEHFDAAAKSLRDAYRGDPIAPLRTILACDDAEGAYRIQDLNTQIWRDERRRIVGRKVGLTARQVQQQMGVDQPDFGVLFADMQVENGAILAHDGLHQPKAEAEIAFILGRDLPARPVHRAELEAAIATAAAAIEIVDSRIADWKITFADTVADNGSAAMFVLGPDRLPLAGLDLWSCGMVLEADGEIVSIGAGAACLGHPLDAALWLVNMLAARGETMREGEVILSGALGPMVPLQPGVEFRATIGGLGTASFRFGS